MTKYQFVEKDAAELCRKYDLPVLSGRLLAASGLDDDRIRELLFDDGQLHTSQAACVKQLCQRLLTARARGEKVFIGGDYDADGICSTAIMKDVLDRLGIACGYYIPDRFREGYGLNPATVDMVADKGYTLIITVDNGVKAHAAIAKAHERGLEILVTDHHQIDEEVKADLVVHPDYMEPEFATLSGAGVALQISRNLLGNLPFHTALAAVAAIGDVMPLWQESRRIVRQGLQAMRQGEAPALLSLLRSRDVIDAEAVGFQIVPRLNSVGRMNDLSNVNTLVPFLLSHDPAVITAYKTQLENVNEARRSMSAKMTEQAEKLITDDDILILYEESFHEGLNGLVAGRIAADYGRPCLVLSRSQDLIKGSGRSVPGFDMFGFFAEGFNELTAFGGHEQAVGLSFRQEDLELFRTHVREKAKGIRVEMKDTVVPVLPVRMSDISLAEIEALQQLEPLPKELSGFRYGLRYPVITRRFAGPKVTKYIISSDGHELEAVLFPYRGIREPETISTLIGRLSVNTWKNRRTCQMEIESLEE